MKKFILLLLLVSLPSRAMDQNCTVDPYYLSDAQIITFTWWQIGTGVWAVVLISSNFLSTWYFRNRHERNLAMIYQEHINDTNEDIALQRNRQKAYEDILNHIYLKHRGSAHGNPSEEF